MGSHVPLLLSLEVAFWRFLSGAASFLIRHVFRAAPARPAFTLAVPVPDPPGAITLHVWTPPGYTRPTAAAPAATRRPLLVSFHGGGYAIGGARDDARWLAEAAARAGVVAVSVAYRLAPAHPFPVGVHDAAAAVRHLWTHAADLGVDPRRTMLSGFSAGGNFSLAVPLLLHRERANGASPDPETEGRIVGIVAFYPPTDYTRSRADRLASNPRSAGIPARLYTIFDRSYLRMGPPVDREDVRLSPLRAPDEMLREALPQRVAIFTCEWDMLLREGEEFRERLKGLGKEVGGRVVMGAIHAWDKRQGWSGPEEKTVKAYGDALVEMERMLEGS